MTDEEALYIDKLIYYHKTISIQAHHQAALLNKKAYVLCSMNDFKRLIEYFSRTYLISHYHFGNLPPCQFEFHGVTTLACPAFNDEQLEVVIVYPQNI